MRYCPLARKLGKWDGRLVALRQYRKGRLCDYEEDYSVLEAVQARRPDLIPPHVDVREGFGILGSG